MEGIGGPQSVASAWFSQTDALKLSKKRELSSVQVICAVVCYAVNISLSFCIGLEICDPPREVRDLLGILLIMNSLVNPFAYAILKSDIKKECEVLFCYKLEKKVNKEACLSIHLTCHASSINYNEILKLRTEASLL